MVEKLSAFYPESIINMLVKKGNESVLNGNPKIKEVLVWDKSHNKYGGLWQMANTIRSHKYDYVINLHRYGSSGFLTMLSGATFKIGFHNNPFSFCYTHKFSHTIGDGRHEVERNQVLISFLTDKDYAMPAIYPTNADEVAVASLMTAKYICIAPGSVWATKRLPIEKWVDLCNRMDCKVYILGAPSEAALGEEIMSQTTNRQVVNLCTNLTLMQSAALMRMAVMNYVNDSAPLHICSATGAACTAFFCSTIPEFGFGPLGQNAIVIQTTEQLKCKPCGIHGKAICPEGHFKCGHTIQISDLKNV